jgi:hypothetical protein
MLSAVLPLVAAAMLSIDTLPASSPEIVPTNGIGVGVGTGPAGDGIMRTCVSIPLTLSPCFAAGLPMVEAIVAYYASFGKRSLCRGNVSIRWLLKALAGTALRQ